MNPTGNMDVGLRNSGSTVGKKLRLILQIYSHSQRHGPVRERTGSQAWRNWRNLGTMSRKREPQTFGAELPQVLGWDCQDGSQLQRQN
ncbi:hypothetical protein RvY_01523-2 [Ramazzottius varieornatus]|uniref:Uncharacterized protein n=1 Tax=Ramazzottius varieornatus TaxID=947166 RepID=A0A1D1UNQ2_RAMVA|nr:hypothetical protein RvY_01523-2 [Ramazzottius varieornatus]